ncbi:Urea active transporter [Rhodotorula toruloides]|nr:Urea active transporter [Rhodotorula toruloides]
MSGYPEGSREFTRLLPPGSGYGVVVGVGAFFALAMIFLTRLQGRFTRLDPNSATEFATASRAVKPGLICCGIVSAWTWSATLLQSSAATYSSGLSSAWWYGVGGTIQICFFAACAAKIKQNANGAVTFPEIARARYGWPCHLLFTSFFLICAHIVTGSLVLGASATINALTGANIIATNFLLPLGIAIYVVAGGLRATFIVDFLHTVILFVILYIFLFSIYGTSNVVGSPGAMYDLLKKAADLAPVAGNAAGSYMTMKSNGGILFGGCTIASGFAGVALDQGYWQRAIASRPESTTRAYMLGGFSWFSIPWAFGTVMGLGARAMITNPAFPTYPYALSAQQVSAGLVAPAAAATIMGKGGAIAILLIVFMAATSACSAELIAVSSLVTRDIIGAYRPLSGHKMVLYSHIVIVLYSIWAGAWSTILHYASIDLGWLFYVQGVLLTPAVIPVALTVMSKRQSKHAAFFGTLFGTTCGLIGWMLGCKKVYGEINITNLALPYAAISGAAPGLVMSGLASFIITAIKPDNYDWNSTRAISLSDSDVPSEGKIERSSASTPELDDEKKDEPTATVASAVLDAQDPGVVAPALEEAAKDPALDRAVLQKVFVRSLWISGIFALVIAIIIPIPMFASRYVFSRRFFEVWVAFSIVWVLLAGGFCIILPIFESRKEIFILAKSALRVMTGRTVKEDVVA